jgi:hypothetical protein
VLKIYIQTVLRVLTIAFGVAYSITGITLVVGLAHMKGEHTAWLYVLSLIVIPAGMTWNPIVNTCIVARVDPLMIATAAAPLAFELLVLVCICLNAFDRPRAVGVQPTLKLYLGFSGVRYAFVGFSSLCPFLGRFCAPPAFRGPGSYVLHDLSEARSAQHLT